MKQEFNKLLLLSKKYLNIILKKKKILDLILAIFISYLLSIFLISVLELYVISNSNLFILNKEVPLLNIESISRSPIKKKNTFVDKTIIEHKNIKYIGYIRQKEEYIVILNFGNPKNTLLKEGESKDGYLLKDVNKDYVSLSFKGKLYKVKISKRLKVVSTHKKQNTNTRRRGFKSNRVNIKKEQSRVFGKEDLSKELNNLNSIYNKFKYKIIKTKYGNFPKVKFVKPESIIDKIGIKEGDIVMKINNTSIMDTGKMVKLISKATETTEFKVEIIRDGQNMELSYEIY